MSPVPADPVVLNTTVPSNFAYVDRMDALERIPRVCTVRAVERELRAGVDAHAHLARALESVSEPIPVVDPDVEAASGNPDRRLDSGETEAFAVADVHDGTLVTDDGPARAFARDVDVDVTGSIGVLVMAVEDGYVTEAVADQWLKRWVDETAYRAPSREFSDYR